MVCPRGAYFVEETTQFFLFFCYTFLLIAEIRVALVHIQHQAPVPPPIPRQLLSRSSSDSSPPTTPVLRAPVSLGLHSSLQLGKNEIFNHRKKKTSKLSSSKLLR